MPNTINASIVINRLQQRAVELLPGLLAPLAGYSTILPLAGAAKTCEVPIIDALPAIKVDPTDFEADTDSTVDHATQPTVHLAQVVKMTSADVQNGALLDFLIAGALDKLALEIQSRAVALFTSGNGFATFSTSPAASFGTGDVAAARLAIQSPRRSLLLDSTAYSGVADRLLNVGGRWTLPGFPGGVWEIPTFASGVAGVCADPCATATTIGPALLPDGQRPVESRAVQIPALGVAVTACAWTDAALRTGYASFECRLAPAVAQTGGAALLVPSA